MTCKTGQFMFKVLKEEVPRNTKRCLCPAHRLKLWSQACVALQKSQSVCCNIKPGMVTNAKVTEIYINRENLVIITTKSYSCYATVCCNRSSCFQHWKHFRRCCVLSGTLPEGTHFFQRIFSQSESWWWWKTLPKVIYRQKRETLLKITALWLISVRLVMCKSRKEKVSSTSASAYYQHQLEVLVLMEPALYTHSLVCPIFNSFPHYFPPI